MIGSGRRRPLVVLISVAVLVSGLSWLAAPPAGADPTTSGTLPDDEVWSGTVTLTDTVTVPEGVTLTIQPGTVVQMAYHGDLIVDGGALLADGTGVNEIIFTTVQSTPTTDQHWRSIHFMDSMIESKMDHVIIENGGPQQSSPYNCAATVSAGNLFTGGMVRYDGGAKLRLTNSVLRNPTTAAISNGAHPTAGGDVEFVGNEVSDAHCGAQVKFGRFVDNEFTTTGRAVFVDRSSVDSPLQFWLNKTVPASEQPNESPPPPPPPGAGAVRFDGTADKYRDIDVSFNSFVADEAPAGEAGIVLVRGAVLQRNWWSHVLAPVGYCAGESAPWVHHPEISYYPEAGPGGNPCASQPAPWFRDVASGYAGDVLPALGADPHDLSVALQLIGNVLWDLTYGDPVQTSTGNFIEARTDLVVPEQVLLGDWTRTYSSMDETGGLLGPGWSTPLDISVDPASSPGPATDVTVRLADGRRAVFDNTGSGVWARPPGVFGDLVWDSDHYELEFTDGRAWTFDDTSGRIESLVDWRGHTTTVDWSDWAGDDTITATSDAGYGLDISGADGQITGVAPTFDADGPGVGDEPVVDPTRQVTYGYDTVGSLEVLEEVTRGTGEDAEVTWTYLTDAVSDESPTLDLLVAAPGHRDRGLVTEIHDAENNTTIVNQYGDEGTFGRVTHQWAPSTADTGPAWSETDYSYEGSDDLVTRVTDVASGDEIVFWHDHAGRLLAVEDPHGEMVQRTYNLAGQLEAATDRRGNTSVSSHDAESGNVTERVNVDGSRVEMGYDSAGRLETRTVHEGASAFVTTYGYDGAERIPSSITGPTQDGSPVSYQNVVGGVVEDSTDADGVVSDYVHHAVTRNLEQVVVDPDDAAGDPELALVTEYGYDSAGRQDRVTVDPAGLAIDTVTTFDPITDQVATVTEEGEDPTVYEYNPDGTLDEVVDPTGAVTAYTYNERGDQETMTQEERIFEGGEPLGTPVEFTTTYGYNASGEMDEVTRPGGHSAAGAPVGLSPASTTTYDLGELARMQNTIVDPAGVARKTVYAYDADGNQCRTTVDPKSGIGEGCEPGAGTGGGLNRSTVTGFDEAGRAAVVTDPLGHTVETVFNERGLVAETTDASERVTAFTYDAAGRQLETKVTLLGGSPVTVEARTYTPGGRLATVTSGSGGDATTTAYGYDDAGRQITATVDPGGAGLVTTTGYDAAGRPTSVTSPGGITSTTTYAFGTEERTETVLTPGRGYTRTVFSERDEVMSTQRTGVGGNPGSPYSTVGFVYDDRGNLSAVTDVNENTVTYTTDGRGNRLTRTSVPDDHEVVETWAYNAADELVAETDGMDRETTYEYNAAGQVASVMDPSGRESVFEYCEAGDAECAAGAVRRVTYHVWADTTPEPEEEPVATEVVAFGYDPSGRRTEAVVDPGGAGDATVYTYGHVSGQVTGVDGPGSSDYTVGYDTAGRRVSLTGPDGVVVGYGYDGAGRLATVDRRPGTAGEVTTYTYDADGRLTGQALPDGQYRAWAYDPASGLLDNFDQLVDGSRRTTNVAHDSLGRRWIDWTDGTVTTFGYDKADQLTDVHRSDSVFDTAVTGDDVSYLYDAVGNRTARIQGPPGDDDGDPEATDGTVEFYEYDDANQLTYLWSTVKDNLRFTYDPAGRRTAMGVDNDSPAGIDPGADRTDYTYGPAGRLDEVTAVEGDHTWVDTRGYDADGNLIGMNVVESTPGEDPEEPPVVVADHTFGYVWDTALAVPQPLQSTTDAPGVTATAVYTNGLGLVGGGTDRVGAEVTLATTPDPTVLTFTLATDVNGSTIPTPNTAGFARAHGYDEYGNPTGPAMGNPHEPALGYRGELQTGDHLHLRARTYHPRTGTFATTDPLDGTDGTPTVANGYHYASNSPNGRVDPLGLRPSDNDLGISLDDSHGSPVLAFGHDQSASMAWNFMGAAWSSYRDFAMGGYKCSFVIVCPDPAAVSVMNLLEFAERSGDGREFDPKPMLEAYLASSLGPYGGALVVDVGDPNYLFYYDVLGNAMWGLIAGFELNPTPDDLIIWCTNHCPNHGIADPADDAFVRAGSQLGKGRGLDTSLGQVLAAVRNLVPELRGRASGRLDLDGAVSNKIVERRFVPGG